MSKARLTLALIPLIVTTIIWAVPATGTAHRRAQHTSDTALGTRLTIPGAIRFREVRDRGLLVDAWINGSGPYTFAIDTGAGDSIITPGVVSRARLPVRLGSRTFQGGLTGSAIVSNQEATIQELALGNYGNLLPTRLIAAVADGLPAGVDGILDPTEAFSPLGYSIDLPHHDLQAFDSRAQPLRLTDTPVDGTVVRWIQEQGSDRPFVRLGDGRLALLDTGSGFGLAVNEATVGGLEKVKQRHVSDLGGGRVQSRRVAPVTVSIGAMVLRSVPTDVLSGVLADTPTILGRGALYPFRITFDPTSRLIAIEPSEN
jgi:hypothetical protein